MKKGGCGSGVIDIIHCYSDDRELVDNVFQYSMMCDPVRRVPHPPCVGLLL